MKVRTGFVSNSSSSSFCAVMFRGVGMYEIMQKLGLPEDAYWEHYYKAFGDEYDYSRFKIDDDLLLFVSSDCDGMVGMEVGRILESGEATVPECKEKLRELIKEKFGVDANPRHIFWDYGEWGGG